MPNITDCYPSSECDYEYGASYQPYHRGVTPQPSTKSIAELERESVPYYLRQMRRNDEAARQLNNNHRETITTALHASQPAIETISTEEVKTKQEIRPQSVVKAPTDPTVVTEHTAS